MLTSLNRQQIGKRIRELRLARGMSQEQLGIAARIGQPAVGRIERGITDPLTSTIQQLASALGADLTYVLGLDDTPPDLNSDLLRRVQRVLECGDKPATEVLLAGLHAAETVIAREAERATGAADQMMNTNSSEGLPAEPAPNVLAKPLQTTSTDAVPAETARPLELEDDDNAALFESRD